MFIILKNFVIHLFILSSTCSPLPNGGNLPKPAIDEKQVQEEMLPFAQFVSMIPNDVERGKLAFGLDMLVRRLLKAEMEVKMLLKNQGGLEKEKERNDLYRVLLGINHRVDTLEQILSCDSNVQLSGTRDVRWKKILNLETPVVQQFRSRIIAAGLTMELFAKAIQKICQEKNDRAGHGDVSLPEDIKGDNVELILTKMKIPKDDYYKRTIQLLISPLTLPSITLPK